jgi:hypothetical protein
LSPAAALAAVPSVTVPATAGGGLLPVLIAKLLAAPGEEKHSTAE